MADSVANQTMDILNRYGVTSTDYDAYVNRWAEKEKEDALYEDKGTLSFTDMLGLMVAQFQYQSIDNQASTTDMMNQLVQMSSMQAMTEMSTQLKEVVLANVMNYSASLVGKEVTLGIYDEAGNLTEKVGIVEGAGTYDGNQVIFVEGKSYYLSSIMAVGRLPEKVETNPDGSDTDDKVDQNPDAGDTDNKTDETTEADNENAVG